MIKTTLHIASPFEGVAPRIAATHDLPDVPLPGETLMLDGVPYVIHARGWAVNKGEIEVGLLLGPVPLGG